MSNYEPTIAQAIYGNKWQEQDATNLSEEMYALSEHLGKLDPESQAHGFLGGEFGYGQDFKNDVFEMHPYYWGDCTCGFEQREADWSENNKHGANCYLVAVRARLDQNPYRAKVEAALAELGKHDWCSPAEEEAQGEVNKWSEASDNYEQQVYRELCKQYGIPWNGGRGCAVHCTCGHDQAYQVWRTENDHAHDCPIVVPNFRHFASGLEVNWYKYIGRGMSANQKISKKQFQAIMGECMVSINQDAATKG